MASFPYRKKWMLQCMEQLMPQCDNFYLWLNGYDAIPEELKRFDQSKLHITLSDVDMREQGRYTFLINNPEIKDDYCFICDDDINYPCTYVQKTIECFERWNDHVLIAYFFDYNQFYREHKTDEPFNLVVILKDCTHYRFGCGVCAFVPSIVNFKFTMDELLANYDMEQVFGLQCHNNNIRVIDPKRPHMYLPFIVEQDKSIDVGALHNKDVMGRIKMTDDYLKSPEYRNKWN